MFKKASVLFFLLIILAVSNIFAVEVKKETEVVLGKRITLYSDILGEEREVDIYLPDRYESLQTGYPVLYLLDGENHFLHASGVTGFLSRNGKIPQLIVVAVRNIDRTRDFTPTHTAARPTTGGEKKFTGFIQNELTKYIEENYRTVPYRILMGHSLGGMYAFYSMLTQPELFNAYIAVSPYLMYDNNFVLNLYDNKFKDADVENKYIYFSVGDESDYYDAIEKVQEYLSRNESDNFEWEYVKYDGENHGTTPHKTLYDGLENLYADWVLPAQLTDKDLETILGHYEKLSDEYGYEVKIPEATLNILGYFSLRQNNYEQALERFKKNVELYPGSANVYDSIGEAYETMGENEKALENYEKAYNISQENNDPLSETFKANYERMKQKNS